MLPDACLGMPGTGKLGSFPGSIPGAPTHDGSNEAKRTRKVELVG